VGAAGRERQAVRQTKAHSRLTAKCRWCRPIPLSFSPAPVRATPRHHANSCVFNARNLNPLEPSTPYAPGVQLSGTRRQNRSELGRMQVASAGRP
jgi:hypothetical protein